MPDQTPPTVADNVTLQATVPAPDGADDLAAEYDFLGELGRGGAAVVHRARNRRSGREVAIKLIRSPLATDADAMSRFAREARTAALLQHPNIVAVHEVRRLRHGSLALVMEYVRGGTLKHRIQQHAPLGAGEVRRTVRQIARALQCAHRHGIVHRDVKPENIFLEEGSGRALLADFGIARTTETGAGLTLDGISLGTPAYMAPEQIDGACVDGRADLYSLALVAWEMLTGDAPWEGETLYGVIYSQKHHQLRCVTDFRSDVPQALIDVIALGAQKEPADRFPDADSMLRALDATPAAPGWGHRITALFRRRREFAPHGHDGDGRDPSVEVERLVEQRSLEPPPLNVPGETIRFRREGRPAEDARPHEPGELGDGLDGGGVEDEVPSRPTATATPEQSRVLEHPLTAWRGTTAHSPPRRAPRTAAAAPRGTYPPGDVGRGETAEDALKPDAPLERREVGSAPAAEPFDHRSASSLDPFRPAWLQRSSTTSSSWLPSSRVVSLGAVAVVPLVIAAAAWAAMGTRPANTAAGVAEIGTADRGAVGAVAARGVPADAGAIPFLRDGTGSAVSASDDVPTYRCSRDSGGAVRCGPLGSDGPESAFRVDPGALLGLRCRVPEGGVALCAEIPTLAPVMAHPRRGGPPASGGAPCALVGGTDGGCWRDAGHAVLPGEPETMPSIAVWVPWTPLGGAAAPQVRHRGDVRTDAAAMDTGF